MIIDFLQSIDSRVDSNNLAAIIFSANSVKCESVDDYWGVTTQTLDESKPKAMYFGNPTTDSLNYECIDISKVNTSICSVEGVRQAIYDLFKRADSNVLFLISTNSEGWTKRTLELFKEHRIIPEGKEIYLISLAILHKLDTEEIFAAMMDCSGDMESLGRDMSFSRKLSLNKLTDIYHVSQNAVCSSNEKRCRAVWEIANELMTHMMKNQED